MKHWINAFAHWVFPRNCCFCGEVSELSKDICSICYASLPWLENTCYRCARQLTSDQQHIYCERCQEKPPAFDRVCALFDYQPPIIKLITRLKFSGQLSYGRILGEIFADKIKEIWYPQQPLPQAIVPVPLHVTRLRQRGYNQSIEFMRPIVERHKLQPLLQVCKRVRSTTPQSQLNRQKRQRNLNGVFKVINPGYLKNIEHIAIVDDVVTTGSTIQGLSLALKENGVARVDVFCCCRA